MNRASQFVGHAARIGVLVVVALDRVDLVTAWWSVIGAEVAHILALLFFCVRSGTPLWPRIRPLRPTREAVTGLLLVCGAQLAMAGLLSIDLIMAGENLGAQSGAFATANRFGRIMCFVSASIAVVLLPRFARGRANRAVVLGLTGLAAVLSLPISVGSSMVLMPLMPLLFPPEVVPSVTVMTWEVGASVGLAVIQVLVTWHVAQARRWYPLVVALSGAVFVGVLHLGPPTAVYYAQASAGVFWMAAVALSVIDVPSVANLRETVEPS